MALVEFSKIKQLFGETSESTEADLFRELFVLVLSRATDADDYSHPAEIQTVQAVIKDALGEDLTEGEVRTAASSKIYESTPLHRCLAGGAAKLGLEQRRAILDGLVRVMKADERISTREAAFFNMVAESLDLTPADAAGLHFD